MSVSLDKALLDVRKAYRLLADYQQRVIELLALIREELGAVNYYQEFRNKPPRSFDRLERSDDAGWRFLPMSDVSVLWRRDAGQEDPIHIHQAGDLLIDVWVRSDTGNGMDDEPELSAEASTSQLRIYFFLCVEPSEESSNWYHKVWGQTNYPALGEAMACDENPGYRAYGEALQLSDLADETAVREVVKALRERASAKLGHVI